MAGKRVPVAQGRRDVFSPHDRSVISREFLMRLNLSPVKAVEPMRGTKKGFIYELRWDAEKKVVLWSVCINRSWKRGEAVHVTDALAEIAYRIDNCDFIDQIDKKAAEQAAKEATC